MAFTVSPVARGLEPLDVVVLSGCPSAAEWGTARGPYYQATKEADGRWFLSEAPGGTRYPLDAISPSLNGGSRRSRRADGLMRSPPCAYPRAS